jgi:hypothetical protein
MARPGERSPFCKPGAGEIHRRAEATGSYRIENCIAIRRRVR